MTDASAFTKLVPGFDFLQSLAKNAGSALPGIGQWVAPTLDPAELDKRIQELRTVQFWLEQNARLLATTIQALEVQRMTLSTLKTMNVQMSDLRDSLTIKPAVQAAADPAAGEAPLAGSAAKSTAAAKKAPAAGNAVDPMQWWNALTTQFTQLATSAMKDNAADASKAFAGGIGKQSLDAASAAFLQAAGAPAAAASGAAQTAAKTSAKTRSATAPRRRAAAAKR